MEVQSSSPPPTLNPLDRFRSWLFVRSGTALFLLTVAFFFFLRVGFSGNNAVPVGVVKTFPTPTTGSFSWSIWQLVGCSG